MQNANISIELVSYLYLGFCTTQPKRIHCAMEKYRCVREDLVLIGKVWHSDCINWPFFFDKMQILSIDY